jgi:predicted O-linked N-acetylglucosamine transferase (SPINDLY family)
MVAGKTALNPPKSSIWGFFKQDAGVPKGERRLAQELLDRGIAAESSGKSAEALEHYREAIDAAPGFAPAHMNLGIALHAGGELAAAIASHRQAIALDPGSATAQYNLALAYLDTGQAAQAEKQFREALRLGSEFPEAWVGLADALEALGRDQEALAALDTAISQRDHYLGAQFNASVLLRKMGQLESAELRLRGIDLAALYASADRHAELESVARQLIRVWPDYALGWRALGTVLALKQRFEEAAPALQKALAGLPSDPEIHNTLSVALQALGRASEAEASIRRALELEPGYYEAHINLGGILLALGRAPEAESSLRRALELEPADCEAHSTLGAFLQGQGRPSEAEAYCRRATDLDPDSHLAHFSLGIALQDLGRLPEAEASFRRAIELKPDAYEAHTNLGNVLQAVRRFSEAETSYRRALALEPASEATHSNLGSALRELGRLVEAEACFRHALELDPDCHEARSNLLFTLNCTNRLSRAELFSEHLAWARQHEAPLIALRQGHKNIRDSRRKLRIGYVSPDFRRHSVAYFIEPVLEGHTRDEFEVFCYSNVVTPDRMTRHLLGLADSTRSITAMSDARAADLVRSDGIDILVDLAGHTARGRLGLFVLKPAPVQVNYLGYPNTSGIGAIDWRLTDFHADPLGEGDAFHSEQVARLPASFLCFRPPAEAPEVRPSPHLKKRYITFGSFNVLSKITPEVVATWARLLHRIQRSRLLLKAAGLSDPNGRERLIYEFAQHGIDGRRLALLPMDYDFTAHLARYHEIDVGLDPFPYNGTTTTLEALWMGVPVISIGGDRHCARVGASILANLGLNELVGRNVEHYQTLAVDLAADRARLSSLRETMRERISASPLRDEAGFVRAMESAYREMWRKWCEA